MLTPCEVAVKTVAPAFRAFLAQTLIEKHDMKETQVALVLGVSQSAVSKYNKKARGSTIHLGDVPEIRAIADQMISLLLANPVQYTEVMSLFCKACIMIRNRGLMCPLCQQNQKPKISDCSFCQDP